MTLVDGILEQNVDKLKGVGPKKSAAFEKLNINKVADFLFHYPRSYEDRSNIKTIDLLENGEFALVRATVLLIVKGNYRYGKKRTLKLLVEDPTGQMEVIFFQGGYLEKAFVKGNEYSFFGKADFNQERLQMVHPDFQSWENNADQGILPVYPLCSGLSQNDLRKWVRRALECTNEIKEYLPECTLKRNQLCDFNYAINNIHFPKDKEHLKIAKFRLIFDELLLLQTGLFLMKNRLEKEANGIAFLTKYRMKEFTDRFPYSMTKAQKRVIDEIEQDMESNRIMNRLIQGDVGSGKTAVAAAALYKAVKSGYQGVLMAPTELLASQHYTGLKKEFEPFGMEVAFLSGAVSAKERNSLLNDLSVGKIQILIGTHALIQSDVEFQKLGLVITDEQHRFGVNQRSLLSEKGDHPDTLVMTATPIPRTLAVILYGDLDISVIDELPPGRQEIRTKAMDGKERDKAYTFLLKQIQGGRQAYVVAPLIEESEQIEAKSAKGLYMEIKERFPEVCVALLHGAMKQKEKEEIMNAFYVGTIQILVSTVVIEVGINVPNATVMLIENAERFGLAQLHQLRGRVGRGSHQSYCILISEGTTEISKQRAEIMTASSDGFLIAEKDLELRGPGEFFGIRQHGVPELKLADLGKHTKILGAVKREVQLILQEDPMLKSLKNKALKEKIQTAFSQVEQLNL